MARKISLPMAGTAHSKRTAPPNGAASADTPMVSSVRQRLGGRAASCAGAGRVVHVRSGAGPQVGVVLFERESEAHVWLGDGRVRKADPTRLEPAPGPVSEELSNVARDARAFSHLSEGQRVLYLDASDTAREGTLVEKCRYGALVLRDDNTVMGVGFRRVWSRQLPRASRRPLS